MSRETFEIGDLLMIKKSSRQKIFDIYRDSEIDEAIEQRRLFEVKELNYESDGSLSKYCLRVSLLNSDAGAIGVALNEVDKFFGEKVKNDTYEEKGRELGALVDQKQLAYGNAVERVHEVMKAFLNPYLNDNEGTYTIPQELLIHLQLMVRTMDKFNRIVNNPKQDLMEENTYNDIMGYALLGANISAR